MEFPAQEQRAKICLPFTFFVLFGLSQNWMMLAHSGKLESSLLGLLVQMLVFPETLSWTQPEIMFYQFSGHPLVQSS